MKVKGTRCIRTHKYILHTNTKLYIYNRTWAKLLQITIQGFSARLMYIPLILYSMFVLFLTFQRVHFTRYWGGKHHLTVLEHSGLDPCIGSITSDHHLHPSAFGFYPRSWSSHTLVIITPTPILPTTGQRLRGRRKLCGSFTVSEVEVFYLGEKVGRVWGIQ